MEGGAPMLGEVAGGAEKGRVAPPPCEVAGGAENGKVAPPCEEMQHMQWGRKGGADVVEAKGKEVDHNGGELRR